MQCMPKEQDTVETLDSREPVLPVRSIPNVLYLHTYAVRMKAISASSAETLQKQLKSLDRCCSAGQPVCPGYPSQSHTYPIFPGQTSR